MGCCAQLEVVVWRGVVLRRAVLQAAHGEAIKPDQKVPAATGGLAVNNRPTGNDGMMQSVLGDLVSVRQLQAYSAICLWQYCHEKGIHHQKITALIRHLASIATTKSLPSWEQAGAMMALPGRGDPVPRDVAESIRAESLRLFCDLVESCVEVGIVDMFGGQTSEPRRFAAHCVAILEAEGVAPPKLNPIAAWQHDDHWGCEIDDTKLRATLSEYGFNVVEHVPK